MTQARFNLSPYSIRVLDMIKGKYGLKNRNEAINRFILEYGDELIEPPLNEKYMAELDKKLERHIKKGLKPMTGKEFDDLFD